MKNLLLSSFCLAGLAFGGCAGPGPDGTGTIGSALGVPLTQLSSDPYTNSLSQHATEVEPDTFAFGNTVVSAFQVGRTSDGGGANLGWATSTDGGLTWTNGLLPGITTAQGGPYDRVTDASVAYDARHNVWLISGVALLGANVLGKAIVVSRSADGLTWDNPVAVAVASGKSDFDKNWTVCDNHTGSPFFGNCYTEFDDFGLGDVLQMTTSTDGGLTWSAPLGTGDNAKGIGGQPLVQPNGTVIVPANNATESVMLAFHSSDGGASWSSTVKVVGIKDHTVAGKLRSAPLPSAEIDAAGTVYLVWEDCRFVQGCKANDMVMSTSSDGVSWSPVVKIPTDAGDHFIPGLAVDDSTAGASAHLALTYYYYDTPNCGTSCQLKVGFVSSADGGAHWSAVTQLAGPFSLGWIANTTQGPMVGDYISTSFVNGTARPAFSLANAPNGTTLDQAIYTTAGGLTVSAGTAAASADGAAHVAIAPEATPATASIIHRFE
jgi:hypothetical protein